MDKKPIDPKASIVDKKMGIAIGFQAVFLTIAVLVSYYIGNNVIGGINMGYSFAFITIITGELLRTYSARSESLSIFKMKLFENKYINYAVITGFALLLIVVFVPGINSVFYIAENLEVVQFLTALVLGFIPLFGGELAKMFK